MLAVQRRVGRYEILREIGRGGMAVVYLARQTDLERDVALKELSAIHAADPAFAERFLRESRVAGGLSHPNIVTVHEYFEDEGIPYIAMEYIERGSLRPWIGRLSLAQIAGVFEGVLAGLAHAETRQIVHRDLKPENVMVTAEGTVKIADFGIAKALNQESAGRYLTATGTTVGTPTYMSPEQAMARDLGPWTDLYSAGVMAYEMLVGQVPFRDTEPPMAILLKHVNEPIPAPRSVRPELDGALADWLERLLAKEPADRTQDAREAWDELEEIVLRILGPRWRREARLIEQVEAADAEKPLTPAPFHEDTAVSSGEFRLLRPVPQPGSSHDGAAADVADDGYRTFVPGSGAVATPTVAAQSQAKARSDEFVTYAPPVSAAAPVEAPAAAVEPPAPEVPTEQLVEPLAPEPPREQVSEPPAHPEAPPTPMNLEAVAVEPTFAHDEGEATIAPAAPPATGVGSFEWPAAGEHRTRKGMYVGAAAVLGALLAAALGFALLSGGDSVSSKPEAPPAQTTAKKPRTAIPKRELIAQSLSLRDTPRAVIATLRFSGGVLGSRSVATTDANLRDGHAVAEVRQRGIRSAVSGGSLPGVTFKVRRSGELLRISVSAGKDAFTKLEARRDRTGKVVALAASRKAEPKHPTVGPEPTQADSTRGTTGPPRTTGGTPETDSTRQRVEELREQRAGGDEGTTRKRVEELRKRRTGG